MKRFLVTTLIVLILLAGGLTGSSYWAGVQAERLYQGYLNQSSQDPGMTLTQDAYQRGVLSSQALTQLTLTGRDQSIGVERFSVPLRQEIYHGPLPIRWWLQGHFTMQPVQAVIRTVLGQNVAGRAILTELFDDREPLTIISTVALDGSSQNRITVPYLDVTQRLNINAITFSGLQGDLQVAPLGRSVKGELSAAAFYAVLSQEQGSTLRLRDLRLTLDQHYGQFGLMVGDSALSLETLETTNLNEAPGTLNMAGLTLRTNVREQGESVNSGFSLAIREINWDQATIGSVHFQLSANKLDGATLAQLRQWNNKHPGSDADPAAIQELLKLLPALLQRNPELVWETQANAPEGELKASAKIVLQDPGPIQPQTPVQWLNVLANANAELTVSKALLETGLINIVKAQLIVAALKAGEEPDEEELANAAALQTQQKLSQLQATQWLRLEDETYRTQARFEQGRLFLNDTEIPWFF
jgi:uncharacterized protein YdgA (DUF945 family)